jgi:hypothetical protein
MISIDYFLITLYANNRYGSNRDESPGLSQALPQIIDTGIRREVSGEAVSGTEQRLVAKPESYPKSGSPESLAPERKKERPVPVSWTNG